MSQLPSVLFVDDEPEVLVGVNRSLRGRYDISMATSGQDALQQLTTRPFSVVVSDMRMPGMDGAELLMQARSRCPDTVRMIMSGHSDLGASVRAINEGQIFRFLLKPLSRDMLTVNVDAALEQHRLVCAEHELLERTLTGAVDALSETLALASPVAFGRAVRLKQIVSALATGLKLPRRWSLEVAATLSQLGAATVPPDTLKRWYAGDALTEGEHAMVARVPTTTHQLLAKIPRLEPVLELVDLPEDADLALLGLEQRAFLLARSIETQLSHKVSLDTALRTLRNEGRHDPALLETAMKLRGLLIGHGRNRSLPITAIAPGMMLASDVLSKDGALLLARGHVVSTSVLAALRNFAHTVGVREPIDVILAADDDTAAAA